MSSAELTSCWKNQRASPSGRPALGAAVGPAYDSTYSRMSLPARYSITTPTWLSVQKASRNWTMCGCIRHCRWFATCMSARGPQHCVLGKW